MADKDSVEKYLENNPQFARDYFDKKVRAEVITAAFNETFKVDGSFKEVAQIQESAIIFDLVKALQNETDMEKAMHTVIQRICLLVNADRCSYFIMRARNGIPELATCLFDITPTSKYENNLVSMSAEIVFPTDMGVVGHVSTAKKQINIPDVSKVSNR